MKDRRLKIFLPSLLVLVLIFSSLTNTVSALDLPDPSPKFFYLDQMDLLSSQSKDEIIKTNVELERKTKAQVVVATIDDLDQYPVEDYALELFRKWEIGDKDLNNGVLILLGKEPTSDKYSIYIATGYGLEGVLNDGKVGRIIDKYFIALVDKEDLTSFDTALLETFRAVISQVILEYDTDLDGNYDNYKKTLNKKSAGGDWLLTLIILVFVIILYLNYRKKTKDPKDGDGGGGGSAGGGRKNPPHSRNPRPYRGRGFTGGRSPRGGFSGGRSSGGGFSGGGGSAGGGGAGRSF
ncbi:MAG: TPM domain-containing protein [Bacillota bacterium]|nr:TPM domain-containing protein [Bacillota bacterium]